MATLNGCAMKLLILLEKSNVLKLTSENFVHRLFEPQHDKNIRPVWLESSLLVQWVAKGPSFLHADSEDSDPTGRMSRLIWVFAGRTCHFVGFVMRRPIWKLQTERQIILLPKS